MEQGHWTDEKLIRRVYELETEDAHLRDCRECTRRWQELLAARALVIEAPEITNEHLAMQRREIYRRIQEPERDLGLFVLTPSLGMALVILFGVLLLGPKPKPQPSLAFSEAQFFSDVYSVAQSTEPLAVEPVRALFEVEQ